MKSIFKKRIILVGVIVTIILTVCSVRKVEAASGDTIADAIPCSLNGSYSYTSDNDMYFKIVLKESGAVTFTITANGEKYYSYSNPTVHIYDNEGKDVAYSMLSYEDSRDAYYLKDVWDLRAGTYYFGIRWYGDTISFTTSYKKCKETIKESQSDTNDVVSEAKNISLNRKYTGQLGVGDYQDFYKFTLPYSGIVEIMHINYTYRETGKYEILNSAGSQIESFYGEYDSNKGYAYDVDSYELAKGTYYLKAYSGKNYDRNGTYIFSIKLTPKQAAINSGKRIRTKATIKIKKVSGVSGYQVQYSTSKKFKKSKTKTVYSKKAKVKIKGLKKKKKYYVRARYYQVVNNKNVYGKWSAVSHFD